MKIAGGKTKGRGCSSLKYLGNASFKYGLHEEIGNKRHVLETWWAKLLCSLQIWILCAFNYSDLVINMVESCCMHRVCSMIIVISVLWLLIVWPIYLGIYFWELGHKERLKRKHDPSQWLLVAVISKHGQTWHVPDHRALEFHATLLGITWNFTF